MLDAMINTGMETGLGDEWIRFGAASEHTVDGSFSERTMAISRPYILGIFRRPTKAMSPRRSPTWTPGARWSIAPASR